MKKLLGALLLAFSTTVASADRSLWRADLGSGNSIELYQDKCNVKKVLDIIRPEHRPNFKLAKVVWDKKEIKACWAPMEHQTGSYIYIVDETGDHGPIPVGQFKDMKKV